MSSIYFSIFPHCASCSALSNFVTPKTVACQAPLSMRFPSKNIEGRHFLLQGIFLTQGLNLGLSLCRQILTI